MNFASDSESLQSRAASESWLIVWRSREATLLVHINCAMLCAFLLSNLRYCSFTHSGASKKTLTYVGSHIGYLIHLWMLGENSQRHFAAIMSAPL